MSLNIKGSRYNLEVDVGSDSPYGSASTVSNPFTKNGIIRLGIKANEEIIEDILEHETLHIVVDRLVKIVIQEVPDMYIRFNYADKEILNLLLMDQLEFSDIEDMYNYLLFKYPLFPYG